MKTKNLPWLSLVPVYLFILSLVLYASWSILQKNSENKIDIKSLLAKVTNEDLSHKTNFEEEIFSGRPDKLLIPSLEINVDVEEGNYMSTTKTWNISDKGAFFAVNTALPNNLSGQTMIYGHNSKNIFGKTKNLKVGDQLFLYTDNQLVFEYTYDSSSEVKPQDTSLFSYEGKPKLTLITCTGFLNKKRSLMDFSLTSVKKTT